MKTTDPSLAPMNNTFVASSVNENPVTPHRGKGRLPKQANASLVDQNLQNYVKRLILKLLKLEFPYAPDATENEETDAAPRRRPDSKREVYK